MKATIRQLVEPRLVHKSCHAFGRKAHFLPLLINKTSGLKQHQPTNQAQMEIYQQALAEKDLTKGKPTIKFIKNAFKFYVTPSEIIMKKLLATFFVSTMLVALAGPCGRAWNCCEAKTGMRVAGGSSCVGYEGSDGKMVWFDEFTTCVWVERNEML